MKSVIILLFATVIALGAKTKIACVGDSITFGAGIPDRTRLSYPAQLGTMLGSEYDVRNYGVSARTMLSKGDHPFIKEKAYRDSLAFAPDVVIIKLGTNDTKPHNWKNKADFINDTKALIQTYKKLASKPRVILCKPVPVFQTKWGINEKTLRGEMSKMLDAVAIAEQVELIDLNIPLRGFGNHFPDKIHPNAFGAEIMAKHIRRYLSIPREITPVTKGGSVGQFYGYKMVGLNDKGMGISYKIVSPKKAAKGKPWVWRARFWGHEPQLDIQLLELGYHVVYCEVGGLFGAPIAVKKWDACYEKMQALGLNKKALLEGMSRGGLIIHNWAVANPDKVAGIICDNGVMDFKSWPAGMAKGKGSPSDWVKCKQAYGFKSDVEAKAYKLNPIETLEILIKANIPLMYLIGDKDVVVPGNENGGLAEKRLDGYAHLKVIHKPNAGHHPHALQNPSPMTDFALQCYSLYKNPASIATPSAEYRAGAGWGGKNIWLDQHNKINQIAKQNKDLELIFLGDSISQSWTGAANRLAVKGGNRQIDKLYAGQFKTASFGIAGDRTEHLLYRIQNGNFDGLNPKYVVVMIGVNNVITAGHNAEQISEGINAVTNLLAKKLPKTKIILLGPLPSGHKADAPARLTLNKVHQMISKEKYPANVEYHNLSKSFLMNDGTLNKAYYSGDGIHLKPQGYVAWAKALKPFLKKTEAPALK